MMAKRFSAAVLVLASLWIASETSADIIERQFVEKGSGRTATGTVLQGSKNMRDLGKRRSSSKSIRVLSPIQAVPGYVYPSKPAEVEPTLRKEVEPQKSKPRFGFGAEKPSDGRTPVETQEFAEPQVENNTTASRATDPKSILEEQALSAPVYQFRYTYPQQRDYYYATSFHGFSSLPPWTIRIRLCQSWSLSRTSPTDASVFLWRIFLWPFDLLFWLVKKERQRILVVPKEGDIDRRILLG